MRRMGTIEHGRAWLRGPRIGKLRDGMKDCAEMALWSPVACKSFSLVRKKFKVGIGRI